MILFRCKQCGRIIHKLFLKVRFILKGNKERERENERKRDNEREREITRKNRKTEYGKVI